MIDKLTFLKGGAEGGAASPDEERLMQLFQNRAGLKKAYADLKDEFHLLRDRLKQQEGATIRIQDLRMIEEVHRHNEWLRDIDRQEWFYWPRLRHHLLIDREWVEPTVQSIDDGQC